jgi:hypothetical protein
MLRKFGLAIAVAAMLVALPGQSKAADLPQKCLSFAPPAAPFYWQGFFVGGLISCLASPRTSAGHLAGSGAGALGSVALGFIGVVAALCAYDLYLKIEGVKNWDGTPKVAHTPNHYHRHAA